MATLLRCSDQIRLARMLVTDVSTVKPGLEDDDWLVYLKEALYLYAQYADGDDSLFAFDTFTLKQDENTAILTFTDVPLSLTDIYLAVQSPEAKLKRTALPVIIAQQYYDPTTKQTPKLFGYDAGGSRDTWTAYFEVKADKDYDGVMWYRREPTPYTGVDSKTPFGDTAAYTIAAMAAARAAYTALGRPQSVGDNITKTLPRALQFAADVALRAAPHGGTLPARAP